MTRSGSRSGGGIAPPQGGSYSNDGHDAQRPAKRSFFFDGGSGFRFHFFVLLLETQDFDCNVEKIKYKSLDVYN